MFWLCAISITSQFKLTSVSHCHNCLIVLWCAVNMFSVWCNQIPRPGVGVSCCSSKDSRYIKTRGHTATFSAHSSGVGDDNRMQRKSWRFRGQDPQEEVRPPWSTLLISLSALSLVKSLEAVDPPWHAAETLETKDLYTTGVMRCTVTVDLHLVQLILQLSFKCVLSSL